MNKSKDNFNMQTKCLRRENFTYVSLEFELNRTQKKNNMQKTNLYYFFSSPRFNMHLCADKQLSLSLTCVKRKEGKHNSFFIANI